MQAGQLQMIRGPNGQVVVQQNAAGQLVAPASVAGAQPNALQAAQMGPVAQPGAVRPATGVQQLGAAAVQQRMAYPGHMVPNIRPGYPGQGNDLIATAAAAAAQQQQQQQQRKMYEAQMMRQQQQDPSRQKQVQKAVSFCLF